MILTKRVGVFFKNFLLELLIAGNEIVRVQVHKQRTQFYDDLICPARFLDLGIQAHKGILHHRFNHNIIVSTRKLVCRDIFPTI